MELLNKEEFSKIIESLKRQSIPVLCGIRLSKGQVLCIAMAILHYPSPSKILQESKYEWFRTNVLLKLTPEPWIPEPKLTIGCDFAKVGDKDQSEIIVIEKKGKAVYVNPLKDYQKIQLEQMRSELMRSLNYPVEYHPHIKAYTINKPTQ